METNVKEENYFSRNFSGTYFSHENCMKIGYIRDDIDNKFKNNEINYREKMYFSNIFNLCNR